MKIKIFIVSLFFSAVTNNFLLAQDSSDQLSDSSGLLGDIWTQESAVSSQKLHLNFLQGYGFFVFWIYFLGLIFTIYTIHRSKKQNYLAEEAIALIYIFWPVFLPYCLFLFFTTKRAGVIGEN